MLRRRVQAVPAILLLGAIGCASGAPDGGGAPTAGKVEVATDSIAPEQEEDLFAQLGPDEMPDRDAEPAAFYNWRVDQMFLNRDKDGDGMISRGEFKGAAAEFDVMDVNGDEFLTKREVADYVFARFVVPQVAAEP